MNNVFINSLIQNNNKVGNYLSLSEEYLNNLNIENSSEVLKNLKSIFSDIVNLENSAKESILVLYKQREKLFSNLISVMLANYYSIKILNGINKYKDYLRNKETLQVGLNKLDNILNDIESSLTAFMGSLPINNEYAVSSDSGSGGGGGGSTPGSSGIGNSISGIGGFSTIGALSMTDSIADKFIEKLDDLIDVFDEIKDPLGFPNVECDENGISGVENIFNIDDSDILGGTIKFYKSPLDGTGDDSLSDTETIFSGKVDENGNLEYTDSKNPDKKQYLHAEVTTKTKKEYFLEDGSEEHPFIIRNEIDARKKGLFSNQTETDLHYALDADFTVLFSPTGDGTLHLRKTIIPNNHAIYVGPLIKKVFFNSKLKENRLDIVMNTMISAQFVWYVHLYYPMPTLLQKTFEFGNAANIDDGSYLNVYVTGATPGPMLKPVLKIISSGTSLKKALRYTPDDEIDAKETSRIKFYVHTPLCAAPHPFLGGKWYTLKLDEEQDLDNGLTAADFEAHAITPIIGSSNVPVFFPGLNGMRATSSTQIEKDTEVKIKGIVVYNEETGNYSIIEDSNTVTYKQTSTKSATEIIGNFSKILYTPESDGETTSYKLYFSETKIPCRLFTKEELEEEVSDEDSNIDDSLKALVDIGNLNKLRNDLPKLKNSGNDIFSDSSEGTSLPENDYNSSSGTDIESVVDSDSLPSNNLNASQRQDIVSGYLNVIERINNSRRSLANSFENSENNILASIKNSVLSYENIEAYRTSNDSNYNNEYIEDITLATQTISGNISQLLLDKDIQGSINILEVFNTLDETSINLKNVINNLILGIVPSLLKVNKLLNNTSMIFSFNLEEDDYIINNIITTLNKGIETLNAGSSSDLGFSPVRIIPIRSYNDWLVEGQKIFASGHSLLSQIYLGYEFGLNIIPRSDNSVTTSMFKVLINDAILDLYYKKLISESYLETTSDIFDRHKNLKKIANIKVNENMLYEKIPFLITNLVPDLNNFNLIDIRPLLLAGNDDKKYQKIVNYVDISIIKYIFKDLKNSNDIITRISDLSNTFLISEFNFKTLYVYYRFNIIVENIINLYENTEISENEKLLDIDFSDLKNITENLEFLSNNIKEYVAIWRFKYYTEITSIELLPVFILNDNANKYLINSNNESTLTTYLSTHSKELINQLSINTWNELADLIF